MRQLAEDTRRTSREMKDEALELAAYRASGYNGMYFGEFEQARTAFETILHTYDPSRHSPPPVQYVHDPKYYAIAYLPVIYWILGYPDQARISQAAAFEYASELNQAVLATHVRIYGGAGLDELLFAAPAVRNYADAIVELADQHNLDYFRLSGLILRGWVMAQVECGEKGLALMHKSVAERLALGVTWFQTRYHCMLAATYLQHGRTEEGLVAIAEATGLATRGGEHMWTAELERFEGELRRLQGASTAEVEGYFQRALAIARGQRAKAFELRAAISLARLWRDAGSIAKARDLLVSIYDWFTEGFDTPDMVEAKTLITSLHG
jgi:predicted ATPase